jgi:hypothetical protein
MYSERNNTLTSTLHIIKRYALNREVTVGSLYDARTDNFLSNLPVKHGFIMKVSIKKPPICLLKKVDRWSHCDLMDIIDIEDELRVSVLLGMTSATKETFLTDIYDFPGNHKVRLICYNHIPHQERLSLEVESTRSTLPSILPNNEATHIITDIRRGLNFVIALELPENVNCEEIDSVLEQLCGYFLQPSSDFLSIDKQQKINRLKPIIFSQFDKIRSLTDTKNFSDICQDIHQIIFECEHKILLSYKLHTIQCIYYDDSCNTSIYHCTNPWILHNIEEKVVPLYNRLKKIEYLILNTTPPQLSKYLNIRIKDIHEKLSRMRAKYNDIQQSLAAKVLEDRRGNPQLSLLQELNSEKFHLFKSELETLQSAIVELQRKSSFIANLDIDYQMKYINVAELEEPDDNQETLETKLSSLDQEHSICYLISTNELVDKDPQEFKRLYEKLKAILRQTTSSLRLVFADFSYCKYKLKNMKILQPSISLPMTPSLIKPTEINILLVGETGVGKSTFINAFVNYLAFHSLQQAENGQPIVLIPVSFLITIGDQFEERKIEFGRFDANEDHNQSGQSVTQYCQSYIFTIANNIKLCIIDTPGIGDTRGIEQDNKNIEHILSYTSHLSHLNAICFLLKPNTTRLHIAFRSCFTQLFNFLGPNARENIIFCFTNTRATFYAPGDTAKLLRTMLNELPNGHKPSFAKENSFCFDSESFRYLTVIKSGCTLAFDEKQKLDFQQSWKMSVTESIRLLDLIKSRPEYAMNKWHSMKHAQMMITLLVRPILETIRNALRNLALWELEKKQRIIELKAQSISLPGWLCTSCSYRVTPIDNISIITRPVHNYRTANGCDRCHCALGKHLPIFYQPQYQLSGTKGTGFYAETKAMKDRLVYGTVIVSQFSLYTTENSENPFLFWLNLFIEEQAHLSSKETSSMINIELSKKLLEEKDAYINGLQDIKRDDDRIKLDAVYNCIGEILAYPMIAEQMNATKESQMKMMKNNEHDVSSQYPHIDGFL